MGKTITELIRQENAQLEHNSGGGGGYQTNRNWLIYLFYDIAHTTNSNTKILEVGCGDGNSLIDICRETHIQSANCTGTSLQPLPNHQTMRNYGINLRTGIIAENLRSDWTEKFDITMACAILMHVDDLAQATNELLRVTTSGGYLLIYDLRPKIATVESIAQQQGHEIIQPRYSIMKNLFGSIIHKI